MAFDQIFVTNKNTFNHQDSYDGEVFDFPPNVQVMIPFNAALHMFAYQNPDKTEALLRLGWANKYDPAVKNYVEDPEGVRKLANFVFEEAEVRPRGSLVAELMAEEPAQA
jgi:hypothetical protein